MLGLGGHVWHSRISLPDRLLTNPPPRPLPTRPDDGRTPMSMLLCSAEKGVNFYVNDPFERTFAPAGRMRKSVDHQEQRVDEIRSVAWVAAWVRSIDASIDVDGWMDGGMDGWTRTDLEHISTHKTHIRTLHRRDDGGEPGAAGLPAAYVRLCVIVPCVAPMRNLPEVKRLYGST